jgi:hypothetical protein
MKAALHHPECGQAGIEAALTMPLVVFLLLGALQLFMLLQARIAAQYAVYKATRAGSLMHGDCEAMTHTAIAALLPTITRTDSGLSLADAFYKRRNNRYADGNPQHNGQIVELYREAPLGSSLLAPVAEDNRFDQPGLVQRLDVRMIYWYRLKIPFADWVMGRMFLAHYGLRDYDAVNPLMPAHDAKWRRETTLLDEGWPGGRLGDSMSRWASSGQYLVPIRVSSSMRMMTPPRKANFAAQGCPL